MSSICAARGWRGSAGAARSTIAVGVVDRQAWSASHRRGCAGRARRPPRPASTSSTSSDRAGGQLAHGADHLGMAGMADQRSRCGRRRNARSASRWTLETSGQVASTIQHLAAARPRPAPPWARRGRRTPPGGRRAPRPAPRRRPRPWPRGSRPRGGCGRSRGAHRPARRSAPMARSTIWMARSTPAQKPRGLASRTVSGFFGSVMRKRRSLQRSACLRPRGPLPRLLTATDQARHRNKAAAAGRRDMTEPACRGQGPPRWC